MKKNLNLLLSNTIFVKQLMKDLNLFTLKHLLQFILNLLKIINLKKELLKSGAKLIVSFGVGTIVTNAVSFTTPAYAIGGLKRLAIGIGSFALSMYASDKVADYTDEKIDEVLDEVERVVCEDDVKKEVTA